MRAQSLRRRMTWLAVAAGSMFISGGTAPILADPPAATATAESPAMTTVVKFLHARDKADGQTMYGLWSMDSRKLIPYNAFTSGDALKGIDGGNEHLSEVIKTIATLFLDVHNQRHYAFTIAGPDPADPTVVLVNGGPSVATTPMTLRVFTAKDADGHVRLDLMKTAVTADPTIAKMADHARESQCTSNLKQISLGMLMYCQDHNNHLPDADKWVDEILPYVKNEALFHDPQDVDTHKWSYAFNRALSGKDISKIASAATTVLLFDSTLGTKNASDKGESLPQSGRHDKHSVFAFADGHVTIVDDGAAPKIGE